LSSSATPEVLSIQNVMMVKKRSGLSSEKRVRRVPEDKASPKATGRIRVILWHQFGINGSSGVELGVGSIRYRRLKSKKQGMAIESSTLVFGFLSI
jgi:hypothetical protein